MTQEKLELSQMTQLHDHTCSQGFGGVNLI